MVKGIGIDIIEVERVRKLGLQSPRFLEKIFTPQEIAYCSGKANQFQHFAARFAAKEAFFKALGKRIPWKKVELVNLRSGKPTLATREDFSRVFRQVHVSVSHLADYAVAVVVLED